jgi:hypothetical protein
MTTHQQAQASACEKAKEQLVDAKTEPEFELASRKIRVVCH